MNNPCTKDCPNRSADCHAKCERYAKWAERVAEARKNRQLHKADEYTINYTISHRRKDK